jgi:uncharacterized repeat protein (TIGR01451 family)
MRDGTSVTIYLPTGTLAFYFYLEPNDNTPSFTATAQDGTSSGPVPIFWNGDARYFGFYAQGGATLVSIQISCTDCGEGGGFAVGEFGINYSPVDLSLQKTATPEIGIAGQELVYHLWATNTGPNVANDVVVIDTLPAGISYLGATAPCTNTIGTVTCDMGSLAAGESKDFLIKTMLPPDRVAGQADGTLEITNTASISGFGAELNPDDNTASFTTLVQDLADLRITKVIEPEEIVQAGETLTYTVFVDNLGPSYARNVKFTDRLLSSGYYSVVNVLSDPNRSDTCVITPGLGAQTSSSSIDCTLIDPLEPFGSNPSPPQSNVGRWMVKVILRPTTAPDISGVTDVFTAEDQYGNPGTPDPDLSNNQAVDFIPVLHTADLQSFSVFGAETQMNGYPGTIIDTSFPPLMPENPNYATSIDTVTSGRRIQWESSTTNVGPSVAQNTRIEVSLPYGASLIESTLDVSTGSCFTEPPGDPRAKVICEYGSLGVGETASLSFQVLIDPSIPAGTQLSLDSYAFSETFDPNLSNNLTSFQFDANNWADLAVQKYGNSSPIPAGSITSYDITYQHKGPSTARNVILTDVLPPGLTPLEVEIIDGILTPSDCHIRTGDPALVDSVTCELGDLLPGASGRLVIKVLVQQETAPGLATNMVTIVSSAPDPNNSDNTDSVDTTIGAEADLEIVKTGDPDKVEAGGEVRFTLEVTNHGPSDAHNVVVTDTLPLEMIYETSNLPGSAVPSMGKGSNRNTSSLYQVGAPYSDLDCQQVSAEPDVVSCTIATLQAGQTRVIEIYAMVDPDVLPGVELVNYAEVASETYDPDTDNNQSNATTYVLGVDLSITKTAVGQIIEENQVVEAENQVAFGYYLTYTLTISNQGYTMAQNVAVTEQLPSEATLLSVTPSKGRCIPGVPGNPAIPTTCNLGSLAGQGSVTITILMHIPDDTPAGTVLYNEAWVDNDLFDPNNSNDFDINFTTVVEPRWDAYLPIIQYVPM